MGSSYFSKEFRVGPEVNKVQMGVTAQMEQSRVSENGCIIYFFSDDSLSFQCRSFYGLEGVYILVNRCNGFCQPLFQKFADGRFYSFFTDHDEIGSHKIPESGI